MSVTVYVCTTCRAQDGEPDDPATRPGQRLFDALCKANNGNGANVRVEPVECLSVCKRPATIAVTGADRWTYIYGDIDLANTSAQDILNGVKCYAQTNDGIVPWRERLEIFKRGVVARIPPNPNEQS